MPISAFPPPCPHRSSCPLYQRFSVYVWKSIDIVHDGWAVGRAALSLERSQRWPDLMDSLSAPKLKEQLYWDMKYTAAGRWRCCFFRYVMMSVVNSIYDEWHNTVPSPRRIFHLEYCKVSKTCRYWMWEQAGSTEKPGFQTPYRCCHMQTKPVWTSQIKVCNRWIIGHWSAF